MTVDAEIRPAPMRAADIEPGADTADERHSGRRLAWLPASAAALAVAFTVSLVVGARGVGVADVLSALNGHTDTIAEAAVAKRIPRTVLALLVGSALAVSGATMQAITRNPLAEPALLGVSGGASLAVVVGIAYFGMSDPYAYLVVAVAGSAAAAVFVYAVGSLGRGGASPLKLALAGAATAAAFASLVSAILLPRVDVLSSFHFWQIGGVGGATWDRIGVVTPFLAVGTVICLANARAMNSLALGDDLAITLGVRAARTRAIAGLGAVVLCGVATSVAGPIAFVGLVVPHVCRLMIGSDHRFLLPASALGGALLLVSGDVLGRVVAPPEEIEVGIITAIVGAPILVWVAMRRRMREL